MKLLYLGSYEFCDHIVFCKILSEDCYLVLGVSSDDDGHSLVVRAQKKNYLSN